MRKTRQLEFFTPRSARQLQEHSKRVEHGGETRVGKRKLARPFDSKRPLHLVLRSTRAKGEWSMLKPQKAKAIEELTYRLARKNSVQIYQFANSGNHIHLLLRAKSRQDFQRFLKTLGALIARLVTGAKKGNPVGKFWDKLAWSRIVNWGRHFFNGQYYVIQNRLEAAGLVPYKIRKNHPRP